MKVTGEKIKLEEHIVTAVGVTMVTDVTILKDTFNFFIGQMKFAPCLCT